MNNGQSATSNKSDLMCTICERVLDEPIQLPCFCTICNVHLRDGYVENGMISCKTCAQNFNVGRITVVANKHVKILLNSGHHLSEQEKGLKFRINNALENLLELYQKIFILRSCGAK